MYKPWAPTPKSTHKANPDAGNGSNFGKTSIGSYEGFINEKKQKIFFWPSSQFFFIPRSLKTARKNRTSPNTGPIKKFF